MLPVTHFNQGGGFAFSKPVEGNRGNVRPAIQGGSNSGRYVTISNVLRVLVPSIARPSASMLVGSAHCTSSKIIRTGLACDSASICFG